MPQVRENPNRNYQCRNCYEIKLGSIIPSSYHCTAAALHSWNDLGLVGDTYYQCSKCRTEVRSQNKPLISTCPQGKDHTWFSK